MVEVALSGRLPSSQEEQDQDERGGWDRAFRGCSRRIGDLHGVGVGLARGGQRDDQGKDAAKENPGSPGYGIPDGFSSSLFGVHANG